jgi:hypothetical protein
MQPEPFPLQTSVQLAMQSDVHAAAQLKVPGLALQVVEQLVLQAALQVAAGGFALHCPSQSATKLGGVHCCEHEAGVVTKPQEPAVVRSQSLAPLASAVAGARITDAAKTTANTRNGG